MTSPLKNSKKPSITIDAWELIEEVLRVESPSPDKPHWKLIAEQERERLLAVLDHRLTVIGVRQQYVEGS